MTTTKKNLPLYGSLIIIGTMLMTGCSQASLETPFQTDVAGAVEKRSQPLDLQSASGIERDSLALVSLYNETGGEDWWKQSGWLYAPLDEWKGVKVEEVNGERRVVELRLGANNLRGRIPTVLGVLTELRVLDLKYNYHLIGEIPEELYDLRELKRLNLRFTSITGTLSPKIGQWSRMDSLSLRTSPWAHNAVDYTPNKSVMTGELPKEIGQLKELVFLDLGRQHFSGTLPEEIGNCTALQEIDLEGCRFTGSLPSSLTNLSELHSFLAEGNGFSGSLPQGMGKMTNLKHLDLDFNQIEGELPAELVQLPHLRILDLSGNRLTGTLPSELGQSKSLFTIQLDNNKLEGDFRPAILPLIQSGEMFYIDLSNNNFTGEVPTQACWPEKHTRLYLKGNRITGAVPDWYLLRPAELAHLIPQQPGYGFSNIQ